MEFLALLPVIWLMVWLMQRPKSTGNNERFVAITLRNMKDENGDSDVVRACKSLRDGRCGAMFWVNFMENSYWVWADSKEELEEEIDKMRAELRS
ncbi:MAG: hypothetical protein IKX36_12110 [Prevotella sp.]|nr:hypothetical protein [Prevotella sp.]